MFNERFILVIGTRSSVEDGWEYDEVGGFSNYTRAIHYALMEFPSYCETGNLRMGIGVWDQEEGSWVQKATPQQ